MVAIDTATQAALNEVAQTTQGVPFVEFLLSPWFIAVLIFVILFTPLGIVGLISLINRLRNWERIRSGWIKIRKKVNSYQWNIFWIRPVGRKLKIKGEEGYEYELPFMVEDGMIGREKIFNDSPENVSKQIKEGLNV